MLLRNKDEQEVVSRERKDRRDFEQLSAMAARMGLHRYLVMTSCTVILHLIILSLLCLKYGYFGSHQYAKVVVFSKVPLPNYRSDLDEKRPQREVFSWIYFMFGKMG